jgi:transcriptional regulator with XRE-family HTH domain
VHNNIENRLGPLVKSARLNQGLTQNQLAEKVGVGLRHIMGIENEGKRPSYELLYHLIRELNISADSIFYPDHYIGDAEFDYLIRLLKRCGRNEIRVVIALAKSLLAASENNEN